jgi:DNA-binding transcriptional regulator GbsR (MarR family)
VESSNRSEVGPAAAGDLAEVRSDFVELWGRMAPFWGIGSGSARAYGYLLSRSEPVDAEELGAALSMSRGAVSMAVRQLESWGLVHPRKEPGSRKVLYAPEVELQRAVRNIIQTRKRREWDPILEHLRDAIPRLQRERGTEAANFRARLEEIETAVALADQFADVFLKGGVVRELGLKALVAAASRVGRRAANKRNPRRR